MIIFPLTSLIFGLVGGLITAKQIPNWYQKLIKPSFNPPNWIFGPAWTTLYIMIGISGYLVWKEKQSFSPEHSLAWTIYFAQLVFNYAWTPLFFYFHMLFVALIEIVIMDVLIWINIVLFYSINPTAGLLLIPYGCWVTFATCLNYSIWSLNKNNAEMEAKLAQN